MFVISRFGAVTDQSDLGGEVSSLPIERSLENYGKTESRVELIYSFTNTEIYITYITSLWTSLDKKISNPL